MLDGLNLMQRFGIHIWFLIGSIAGLLAIAASFFQENTFSMLERVSKLLNLEEPIRSFNSWVTSYDTNALAVVGAVLIFVGIYRSFRTLGGMGNGPRTLSPATAWIGYALMQPSGAATITAVVLITFILAALATVTDREEYEAANLPRFRHLRRQLRLAIDELFVTLIYIVLLPYGLLTRSASRPSSSAPLKGSE